MPGEIYTINDYVTLSAANTFTQKTIQTNLALQDRQAIRLHRISIIHPLFDAATAAQDLVSAQLTKSSQSAMVTFTNNDLVARVTLAAGLVTSGAFAYSTIQHVDFSRMGGLLLAKESLFFGAITAGFASADTFYIRLYYELVKLSQSQMLSLVTD